MGVSIQGLSEGERQTLAGHFARQPSARLQSTAQGILMRRGELLALKGDPGNAFPPASPATTRQMQTPPIRGSPVRPKPISPISCGSLSARSAVAARSGP
jgi:hypothetical protein